MAKLVWLSNVSKRLGLERDHASATPERPAENRPRHADEL